jgi:hypothetical protein
MQFRIPRLAAALSVPLLAAAIGGCGYVQLTIWLGDDPDEFDELMMIDSPTSDTQWDTSASTIVLSGRSFVPSGSSCTGETGTIASGYRVAWLNTLTGETGLATAILDCQPTIELRWITGSAQAASSSAVIIRSTSLRRVEALATMSRAWARARPAASRPAVARRQRPHRAERLNLRPLQGHPHHMDAERLNSIANLISDLASRGDELRRYL